MRTTRVLPYYPDFLGYDVFKYTIKLDKPYKLTNPYKKNIVNKLGKYELEVTQVKPNLIKVSSLFVINHEIVQPEDIQSVIDVSREINHINNYELKLSAK